MATLGEKLSKVITGKPSGSRPDRTPTRPGEGGALDELRQGHVDYVPGDPMEEAMNADPQVKRYRAWLMRTSERRLEREAKFTRTLAGLHQHLGGRYELLPDTLEDEPSGPVDDWFEIA